MNNLEFAQHFADHAAAGVLFVMLGLAVTLLVLRRHIYAWFDPLLFYAVLSAMAGSVVLYLAWFELIRPFYFWSYLLTQAAFLAGFLLLKPARRPRVVRPPRGGLYSGPVQVLYPLSVVVFVATQLAVYAVTGLPLLLESRLEAFAGGGGYGLLSRLLFVTSNVTLLLAAYRLLVLRRGFWSRVIDGSVILFCIAVAILSGSKGALLSLIFTVSLGLFFASRFHGMEKAERRMRRFFVAILVLSFPVAIGVISIQAGIQDVGELVLALTMRFLQTGDIFFMVYPDDILAQLPQGNGLLALLYSPLGSLRIVERESLPVNLGLLAFWFHYDTDLLTGPNARHNVFGLHYFGPLFSVAFSFLLGLLLSLARNAAFRRLPASPMGMVTYMLVVSCAIFIEQDVSGQAIEYFFSVLLVFPLLYVLASLMWTREPRPRPGLQPVPAH